MRIIRLTTLLLLVVACLVAPASARRKSEKGPHPIKVLKIVQDGAGRGGMNNSSGRYHVWLQNTTDVAVDKIQLEMELYSDTGRLVDKVSKEIGVLESGAKNMAELRYNVIGERNLKPRFWVLYNAGKEKLTEFELDGPSWNY